MAFIRKVLDHVLNHVLVEGLANARWFQRFAVKTTQMVQELGATGKGSQGQIGEQMTKFYESAKQQGSKFRAEFEAELRKTKQPGGQQGRDQQHLRK